MVSFPEDYIINEQLSLKVCIYVLAVEQGRSTLYEYWKTWL